MKKSFLRSTLLAAMIASISGPAAAAGLGRINVFSSLGQPLRAEVDIAATPDELEAMTARLASAEAHARANIEFVSDLTAVRMSIERRSNGSAVVRISSDRAFNEPFVDMLVELTWNGGRILREYTFLLDPSETASAAKSVPQITEPAVRVAPAPAVRPEPTTTPAPAASATPAPAKTRPSQESKPASQPAPKAEKPVTASAGDYTVKSGDSATSIANKLKPVEVTRDQMVAALYQANKDSFNGGNINRLSTGKILRVPTAQEAAAIDKAEARQIIVKASSFDALKGDIARAAEQGPARDATPAQASSGKVSPRVEDKPVAGAQRDQLKIGRSDTGADAKSASRIKALEEDVVARDKALKEAKSRAEELERNVKELEKLVKMKTDSLAELQKQAAAADAKAKEALKSASAKATKEEKAAAAAAEKAAKAAAAAAEKAAKEEAAAAAKAAKAAEKAAREKAAADEKAAKEKAVAEAKAAKEKAAADAKAAKEQAAAEAKAAKEKAIADEKAAKEQAAAAAKAAEEQAAAEKLAREQAEAQAAAAASAAAATSEAVVEASAPEAAPVASASVAAPAPAPVPAPADTAQVVEESGGIFSSPLILAALAAAAGGLGFVFLRNRRRNAAAGAMTTSLSESSTSPNSVFGNAGGQTVDTGTSMLHTDFSQSGLSAIDSDEGVDPVAEADVYMAYGRDAQAEEILQDALKNDPTRVAIYLKLLEIYAQRRSVKQFENVATDLYTQTGGVGDEWAKAAALGARLDPGNPLYGQGETTDNTTVIIPKAQAAELPVEISLPVEAEPAPQSAAQAEAVSFGTNNVSQMRATWTVPGEIGQLAQGDGDLPVMPEPEPEPSLTATSPEPLNLDFNLDLELPQGDEPETRIEAREDDDGPLSIDTQPDFSASESAPLEFDLDVEPAAAPAVSAVRAAEAELDKAMSVMSSTDADMGIERAMERSHVSEVDLEKTNFESSLLDFDFELGEDSNVSRSNMDLSDIQLGNSANLVQPQAEMVDTSAASTPATGAIDLNDEVSTKLELARAYEEMGDIEGAKELLDEVMTDGADVQKEMARTILTRIA